MKRIAETTSFKILLVEDPLCRRDAFNLCNEINQFPPTQVSARIADIEDALRAIQIFNPDIVLIDLNSVHRKTAMQQAESMREISPMLKVIFACDSPAPLLDSAVPVTALSGWSYWLNRSLYLKGDISSLLSSFSKVITGDINMPKKLEEEFLLDQDFLSVLTPAQKMTIELLSRGFSNKEIARIADLKVKTVERNIARATKVLGVEGSEHENNKRVLLVLEYLRRVDHHPQVETLYS